MTTWEERLDDVLADMKAGNRPTSLSLPALKSLVDAPSAFDLSAKVAGEARDGRINIMYRVLSPETRTEISSFKHFWDIPQFIFDDTIDQKVEITPSRDIEIYYTVE